MATDREQESITRGEIIRTYTFFPRPLLTSFHLHLTPRCIPAHQQTTRTSNKQPQATLNPVSQSPRAKKKVPTACAFPNPVKLKPTMARREV